MTLGGVVQWGVLCTCHTLDFRSSEITSSAFQVLYNLKTQRGEKYSILG